MSIISMSMYGMRLKLQQSKGMQSDKG